MGGRGLAEAVGVWPPGRFSPGLPLRPPAQIRCTADAPDILPGHAVGPGKTGRSRCFDSTIDGHGCLDISSGVDFRGGPGQLCPESRGSPLPFAGLGVGVAVATPARGLAEPPGFSTREDPREARRTSLAGDRDEGASGQPAGRFDVVA